MYGKLLMLICITLGSCADSEITMNSSETTRAEIPRRRKTVFDKKKEHSEEELAWKRKYEIFQVFLDENNQIFIGDKLTELKGLKEKGKTFYYDYWKVSDSPFAENAMISLRSKKGTDYQFYLSVYNELRHVYSELWAEEAQKTYKKSFDRLKMKDKKTVRGKIPLVISESEPAEF